MSPQLRERELRQFLLLDRAAQRAAIQRLAATGFSDYGIEGSAPVCNLVMAVHLSLSAFTVASGSSAFLRARFTATTGSVPACTASLIVETIVRVSCAGLDREATAWAVSFLAACFEARAAGLRRYLDSHGHA